MILALVLTVGALYGLAGQVKPDYDGTASVVLIPPKTIDDPLANRYLGLGGLGASVDVLARSMASDATAKALHEAAPGAEYVVASDASTSAPIVTVTATSKSRARAEQMLNAALVRLPKNLRALQETLGITSVNQITTVQISRDSEPKINQKTRIRVLVVAVLALLFMFTVLIAAFDGLLLRRSAPEPEPGEGEDASDVPRRRRWFGRRGPDPTPAPPSPAPRPAPAEAAPAPMRNEASRTVGSGSLQRKRSAPRPRATAPQPLGPKRTRSGQGAPVRKRRS